MWRLCRTPWNAVWPIERERERGGGKRKGAGEGMEGREWTSCQRGRCCIIDTTGSRSRPLTGARVHPLRVLSSMAWDFTRLNEACHWSPRQFTCWSQSLRCLAGRHSSLPNPPCFVTVNAVITIDVITGCSVTVKPPILRESTNCVCACVYVCASDTNLSTGQAKFPAIICLPKCATHQLYHSKPDAISKSQNNSSRTTSF